MNFTNQLKVTESERVKQEDDEILKLSDISPQLNFRGIGMAQGNNEDDSERPSLDAQPMVHSCRIERCALM